MSSIPEAGVQRVGVKTWPGVRAVIAQRKAEAFAEQTWRPGCFRCGAVSEVAVGIDEATAWSREHRLTCPR